MRIWILGANGLLGQALQQVCGSNKIPFLASSKAEVDITDLEFLRRKSPEVQCTHILNCAAYTDVDGAEKNPAAAFGVNAKGPENLGIVARENGIHVLHVSTDYVFDGEKRTPYKEDDKTHPLGVYGKSKREGEERLLKQLPTACIVRTSWVFGSLGKNFISGILSKLLTQESIQAVDDQINRATYSRDLARALLNLSFHQGIFHYANSEPMSRYQIVKDFYQEALARKLPIACKKISPISGDSFPALSPRPVYSVLDTEKVSHVLGRKPSLWDTVVREYFDYETIPLFSKHAF